MFPVCGVLITPLTWRLLPFRWSQLCMSTVPPRVVQARAGGDDARRHAPMLDAAARRRQDSMAPVNPDLLYLTTATRLDSMTVRGGETVPLLDRGNATWGCPIQGFAGSWSRCRTTSSCGERRRMATSRSWRTLLKTSILGTMGKSCEAARHPHHQCSQDSHEFTRIITKGNRWPGLGPFSGRPSCCSGFVAIRVHSWLSCFSWRVGACWGVLGSDRKLKVSA